MIKILAIMESRELSGPAKNLLDAFSLLRDELEVVVVTYLRGAETSSPFIETVEQKGFQSATVHERFRYDPSVRKQLQNIIDSQRPALIQVHNTKSRFLLRSLKKSPVPRVSFFHGETWVDRKQQVYNRLDRWLFTQAQHVVVVAETQVALLAGWGVSPERMTVIPNGILVPEESPPSKQDHKTILSVGRLSREKGHALLLESVKLLVERGEEDFDVKFVGDGPERQTLEAFVHANGLDDRVTFEGYQSDPLPYYREAGLFVLPSFTEGFPNVLLEASVYEIPFISFAVGGIPSIFEHPAEAMLLPEPKAGPLADALMTWLEDPRPFRERARKAREKVLREYSMEKKAERLLAYYQELTGHD